MKRRVFNFAFNTAAAFSALLFLATLLLFLHGKWGLISMPFGLHLQFWDSELYFGQGPVHGKTASILNLAGVAWLRVEQGALVGWRLHIPYLAVICVAAVPLFAKSLMWTNRARVARSRIRRGLCPQCGYDLCATPERCPECGTEPLSRPAPPALCAPRSGR